MDPMQLPAAEPASPGDGAPLPPTETLGLEEERTALRIQAAAVAAQQSALVDVEERLRQEALALQRQEAQLAELLEERRREAEQARTMARAARTALRQERQILQKERTKVQTELTHARQQVRTSQELVASERRRLLGLRRRLIERYARLGGAREQDLQAREAAVTARETRMKESEEALAAAQLHATTASAIEKRQLREAWMALRQARQEWQLQHARQEDDLHQRSEAARRTEQRVARIQHEAERTRRHLQQEVDGLEARARNLRQKIRDEGGVGITLLQPLPPQKESAAERDILPVPMTPVRLLDLNQIAEELADQRQQFLEQLAVLLELHSRWEIDQRAALREIETAGQRLAERENDLLPRERALEDAEAALRRRQAEMEERGMRLDVAQERWAAEQARVAARLALQAADLELRTQSVERRGDLLMILRQRWTERWRGIEAELKAEVSQCLQVRQQAALRGQDYLERATELERQQRALAKQALALEQYRLEVQSQAPDPTAAEKRLKRLRRGLAAPLSAARRRLAVEARSLDEERSRLEDLAQTLMTQREQLALNTVALARQRQDLEEMDRKRRERDEAREWELANLHLQRASLEHQLKELGEGRETMARLLIDAPVPQVPLLTAWAA